MSKYAECANMQMCKFFEWITQNKCKINLIGEITSKVFAHLHIF
jgi:hypothetical protein